MGKSQNESEEEGHVKEKEGGVALVYVPFEMAHMGSDVEGVQGEGPDLLDEEEVDEL